MDRALRVVLGLGMFWLGGAGVVSAPWSSALMIFAVGDVDSTPDLQLLRDFVSRRQGASGGVADPGELAQLMEMAPSQMESKLTVLLGSRSA